MSGQPEGLAQLPDGQFPPMELRCAERLVRDKVQAKWGGERRLTIGRVAILTRNPNWPRRLSLLRSLRAGPSPIRTSPASDPPCPPPGAPDG